MKQLLAIIFILLFAVGLSAQEKIDKKLQKKITELSKEFHGDVGSYVKNLKTGKIATLNADTIFQTASMVKVPITCGIFNKIAKGELNYHANLTYRDSLLYPGEDILGAFKDSAQIALSKVLILMITTSDNTASLWCQSMAGGGTEINNLMANYGLKYTRVNLRTESRKENYQKYGWGQTTPREMATLVTMIRDKKMVDTASSERIYRSLTRIYFDAEALAEIPPIIQVASKSGAVDAARSEVCLVNAPHGDYVFCITTKNNKDTSWKYDNEAWVMIRSLSKMLWNYYEPHFGWERPTGMDKFDR
ncbi:beta-lactamase class A [Pedobacter sp. UYP30]|uniref:serine hydrolase n=1 Tax=Pedobacter sp. UYP30 TaxID=1756400 RepID=UPI003397CE89